MKLWGNKDKLQENMNWGITHKVIYYDDPAWIKIVSKINDQLLSDYQKRTIPGQDVNSEWLFEELQNLSLFSEKKVWNILNAEKISTAQQNKILLQKDILKSPSDSILWFWVPYNNKHAFWKKLEVELLEIDKLSYWEEKQCVQWLMAVYGINNIGQINNLWPWEQELTLSQHLQLIEMISSGLLELENASTFFEQVSFENEKFQLLDKFEFEDITSFFLSLKNYLEKDDYTGQLRTIQFLRSHIFKMLRMKDDAKYVPKSSFEKKIMISSQKWHKKDLSKYLKLFLDWEMKLKAQTDIQFDWALEYLPKLTQ